MFDLSRFLKQNQMIENDNSYKRADNYSNEEISGAIKKVFQEFIKDKEKKPFLIQTKKDIIVGQNNKEQEKRKQKKNISTEKTDCSTEQKEKESQTKKANDKINNEICENNNECDNKLFINEKPNNNDADLIFVVKNSNKANDNLNVVKEEKKKKIKKILNKTINKPKARKKSKDDKYIKGVRIVILSKVISFINKKIRKIYNNDKKWFDKQFKKLERSFLYHTKNSFDEDFIQIKLKDILSLNISPKYTYFKKMKNKELVESLTKGEKDPEYFQKLFDLSFLDCLEHIRGPKKNELLDGLLELDDILNNKEFKKDKDEIGNYKECIINYELFIRGKKSRKRKNQ